MRYRTDQGTEAVPHQGGGMNFTACASENQILAYSLPRLAFEENLYEQCGPLKYDVMVVERQI